MVYHEDGTYRVAPAHIKAKGMGGKRNPEFDHGHLVPLCYASHNLQHQFGFKWIEEQIGMTIQEKGEELWEEYLSSLQPSRQS